jgi:hypothetical protein
MDWSGNAGEERLGMDRRGMDWSGNAGEERLGMDGEAWRGVAGTACRGQDWSDRAR